MKELVLDGSTWKTQDDIYESLFRALGAPSWHGKNFNALRDSIAEGSINSVDSPYIFVLQNYDLIGGDAKPTADNFIDLIREMAGEGSTIGIRIEH